MYFRSPKSYVKLYNILLIISTSQTFIRNWKNVYDLECLDIYRGKHV